MDLQAGRTSVEGYAPRHPDDWSRLICRNCHHPVGLVWMIDPRLREPLRISGPVERLRPDPPFRRPIDEPVAGSTQQLFADVVDLRQYVVVADPSWP